jgi:hypothetical protein
MFFRVHVQVSFSKHQAPTPTAPCTAQKSVAHDRRHFNPLSFSNLKGEGEKWLVWSGGFQIGGGQFAICCFRLTHTCKIPRELAVLKDKEWEGFCFTLMIAEVRCKESDVV